MFGKNWNKIQKYIQTRSCPQTRSHAQKFFRKLQKHGHLKGMSTSSDPFLNQPVDQAFGRRQSFIEEGGDCGNQSDLDEMQADLHNISRSLSMSQAVSVAPKPTQKRPRLNSIRSDKRGSNHDLSELERRVVEVLNRYSNGATSLRISKLDSDQGLGLTGGTILPPLQ